MPDFRTLRIDALKTSRVSGDGNAITVVCENQKGKTNLIEMTPETAAALVGGLRDACKKSAERRAKAGIEAPLEQVWTAERVFATYPVHGKVLLHVQSGGMTQVFELPSSEVATLVHELSDGLRAQGQDDPAHHDIGTGVPAGTVIPSVLTLSLATVPIRTMGMTDYPDGLAVEMGQIYPNDDSKRVRIPMFSDTARALIGALQERLSKIDGEGSTSSIRKPS